MLTCSTTAFATRQQRLSDAYQLGSLGLPDLTDHRIPSREGLEFRVAEFRMFLQRKALADALRFNRTITRQRSQRGSSFSACLASVKLSSSKEPEPNLRPASATPMENRLDPAFP